MERVTRADGPADVHDRIREFWDADAETYDHAPGHSVNDPALAAAWRDDLARRLPPPPARILDVGAGTGALALLAAELGHRVTALDLSPAMLDVLRAKARARGLDVEIVQGPADRPPEGPFDAVMERHVVWTLPDPVGAFRAWRGVLAAGGLGVFYQGLWNAGLGGVIHKAQHAAIGAVRRLQRAPQDHHAEYEPDLRASLPFGHGVTPQGLALALGEAGWSRYRVERLHAVERAERRAAGVPRGWVERVPRYVLLAEAS